MIVWVLVLVIGQFDRGSNTLVYRAHPQPVRFGTRDACERQARLAKDGFSSSLVTVYCVPVKP